MKKSEVSMAKIRESFAKTLVEGDVQSMCLPFNFCRKYGSSWPNDQRVNWTCNPQTPVPRQTILRQLVIPLLHGCRLFRSRHHGYVHIPHVKAIGPFHRVVDRVDIQRPKMGHRAIRKTVWVEFPGGHNWRVNVEKKHMFSAKGKLEEVRTFDEGWAAITEFYGVKTGVIAQALFKGTTGFFIRFFTAPNKEINYPSRSTSSLGFVRDATDDSSSTNLIDEMVTDEEDVEAESCRPGCFTKKFQLNDSKKLYLHKGFFTPLELEHQKEIRVYMEGCNMFTEVAVKCRAKEQTRELQKGWGDFISIHGLKPGDTVHFSAKHDVASDILRVTVSHA